MLKYSLTGCVVAVHVADVCFFCVFAAPYSPVGDVKSMWPGTWYITATDDKHRRTYQRVPLHPAATAHKVSSRELPGSKWTSNEWLYWYVPEATLPNTSLIEYKICMVFDSDVMCKTNRAVLNGFLSNKTK